MASAESKQGRCNDETCRVSALGSKMRLTVHGPMIWCPGCKCGHLFYAPATPNPRNGAKWTWDGNIESPTFNPSMHVRIGKEVRPGGDPNNNDDWLYETACHSFVRNGMIEFLGDCTHAMKGTTVALPVFPGYTDNEDVA